ncbi:hypothetical protein L1049_019201 [Liquidambar formosana]|uniref:DDE Tnp4 domain-containing protein n=1 Tax=Liquidambar formosana TaxID=63359 RepID=A0AAP0WMT2_LIQFO
MSPPIHDIIYCPRSPSFVALFSSVFLWSQQRNQSTTKKLANSFNPSSRLILLSHPVRYFNLVLNGVIRLQSHLLKQPEAVSENSTDGRWKWFKNCLGALDETYVSVTVPEVDKPRYQTRKNDIATNVLGVCSQDMQFIFVLPGWEGSAADSRVLRDAVSRRHGLKVLRGTLQIVITIIILHFFVHSSIKINVTVFRVYYLVDTGYPNGEGFLALYRGQRYHLND